MRAGNVNRTHAYAVHRRALSRFQYHITNAVDFATAKGGWHIDHQIGRAHERSLWPAYCARRWLAGQRGGKSSITGRVNATLWWHPRSWAGRLPFVEVPGSAGVVPAGVHCGNNLKPGTCEDIGLDACVELDEKLAKWLAMIAHGYWPHSRDGLCYITRRSHPKTSGFTPNLRCAGLPIPNTRQGVSRQTSAHRPRKSLPQPVVSGFRAPR